MILVFCKFLQSSLQDIISLCHLLFHFFQLCVVSSVDTFRVTLTIPKKFFLLLWYDKIVVVLLRICQLDKSIFSLVSQQKSFFFRKDYFQSSLDHELGFNYFAHIQTLIVAIFGFLFQPILLRRSQTRKLVSNLCFTFERNPFHEFGIYRYKSLFYWPWRLPRSQISIHVCFQRICLS